MLGMGPEEDKFENGGHGGFLESFKVWMQAFFGGRVAVEEDKEGKWLSYWGSSLRVQGPVRGNKMRLDFAKGWGLMYEVRAASNDSRAWNISMLSPLAWTVFSSGIL